MEVLKLGSKGSAVKKLQELLNKQGYGLIADGIFGEITDECVRDYQKKNNLTVDGIVGNKTWNSLTGSVSGVQTKRKINMIVLHCAATPEGKEFTNADIKKWHIARGFGDIGYHYVIYLDGSVHPGRDESKTGAHVSGYNSHSLGICYIGGCDKNGKGKDTRNSAQKKAQIELVHDLLKKYNLSLKDVYGHYQFANKHCPSHTIEQFRKEYTEYYK